MKKYIATGAVAVVCMGGVAAAQTVPSLSVNVYASPRAERGANDALLALIALSTESSSGGVQVPSIPVTATFAEGATVTNLSDCRIRDVDAYATPLNNGGNAVGIVSGMTRIPLDTPLSIAASTTRTLALTCDIAATAPLSGTITLSMTPSALEARGMGTTSVSVTPTVGRVNGSDGPLSGMVTIVARATPVVPGVPNTGSDAFQNLMLLVLAGGVAYGGYVAARKFAAD